jgi:hypothetical protein
MDNYTKSVHLYADLPSHGPRSLAYLSTLANLGLLYKDMSTKTKGMEKEQLLQRAEEALVECVQRRKEIQSSAHRLAYMCYNCNILNICIYIGIL